MTSESQLAANRLNAQHSTGPQTPEGKLAVSQNAFKHGARSRAFLQHRDDLDEYQALLDQLTAQWNPVGIVEEHYVERIALSYWKLGSLEAHVDENLASIDNAEAQKKLETLVHYIERYEHSYDRAVAALLKLQKARQPKDSESARPPARSREEIFAYPPELMVPAEVRVARRLHDSRPRPIAIVPGEEDPPPVAG